MKLMPFMMSARELPFCLALNNQFIQCKSLLTHILTIKNYFVRKTLHIKKGSPLIKRIAREGEVQELSGFYHRPSE
jgi:hypothetical protein